MVYQRHIIVDEKDSKSLVTSVILGNVICLFFAHNQLIFIKDLRTIYEIFDNVMQIK